MTKNPRDRRQLDLFGSPPEPPPDSARRRAVGPAPASEEIERIARGLPASLRLGTSSWSFPGWAGIVYDRAASVSVLARHGLAAYARHPILRTVGVDRTFYAPVPAETLAAYAAQVPAEFRFLVKAPWACTSPHVKEGRGPLRPNPKYLDAEFACDRVIAPFVEGLAGRAGPLVFQFPPQGEEIIRAPERFAERLERFLRALPRGPLYAVELRDRELLVPAYRRSLESSRAQHCLSLHPRMPSTAEQWRATGAGATGPLVVRWMLRAGRGYDEAKRLYAPFSRIVDDDPATRSSLAELCLDHCRRGLPVFVIANNKAEGSAPETLVRLAARIIGRASS